MHWTWPNCAARTIFIRTKLHYIIEIFSAPYQRLKIMAFVISNCNCLWFPWHTMNSFYRFWRVLSTLFQNFKEHVFFLNRYILTLSIINLNLLLKHAHFIWWMCLFVVFVCWLGFFFVVFVAVFGGVLFLFFCFLGGRYRLT